MAEGAGPALGPGGAPGLGPDLGARPQALGPALLAMSPMSLEPRALSHEA